MTNKPRRARKEAGNSNAHDKIITHEESEIDPTPDQANTTHVDNNKSNIQRDTTTPLAYFITFTTYGTWLHGDDRGSVDPANNIPGTPFNQSDPHRKELDTGYRKGDCATLDARQRLIVQSTINEVAKHRDWMIHALNVRTNHVHMVISAHEKPERVMNSFKSWSTRRMVEAGVLASGTKTWTRHGSTRYLWKEENVQSACQYVCEGQGPDLIT